MIKDWNSSDVILAISKITSEYRLHGDELALHCCPYCGAEDYKFSINIAKQTFICNHANLCGARGTLYKLLSDRGVISPITKAVDRSYRRPVPDKAITATDEFYLWYSKERGISAEILKKFNVGFKDENGKRYMVYHYVDEHRQELNRKYRNVKEKKDMRTERDAEHVYYGVNNLDFDQQRLIVVSGEDDVHALYQMGVYNAVSVPFGDKHYSPAMDMINSKFQEIILLFDADESGQSGAYNFAMKAGMHKCRNVVLPFKDSRDCLINGCDIFTIEKEISNAKPFRCQEIICANDAKEAVIKNIFSKRYLGIAVPCKEFNKMLGGVRTGELTVLIAHTGSGKTTFALNYTHWCLQAGMKALILSFENQNESIIPILIEIRTEETIKKFDTVLNKYVIEKSVEWIEGEIDKLSNQELYFLNRATIGDDGYYDLDKLVSVIEYAKKFYDVNFVLIDHLHYFLKLSEARNPVHIIDESIRKISQVTQRLDIHTVLIVHPSKIEDGKNGKLIPIGLNSAKGASSIQQEAFNFMTIAKKTEDGKKYARLQILKNRIGKMTGDIVFDVLDNMNTYKTESMDEKQTQPNCSDY